MEKTMKNLIVDLDGTLTHLNSGDYENVLPRKEVIKTLQEYKKNGYNIVISTARNMRTYEGNVGKINIHTLPIITKWLEKHQVPFDEIHVGKPWCGHGGFYIDDKAVRPSEFTSMTEEEIKTLLSQEK